MTDVPAIAITDPDPAANLQYVTLCDLVLRFGRLQPSRIGRTKELLDTRFVCNIGDIPRRPNMNLMIGWAEMLQFIAGEYTPETLERVAPNANLALFTKNMAYGLRTNTQMPYLLDELRRSSDTRRAVLYVGNADDQIDLAPCTNTIQFVIRDDHLTMLVSMRSWDLIKGLPYDVMMFGGFGMAVAGAVRVKPGILSITAGSAHIYEEDLWMVPTQVKPAWRFKFTNQELISWWPNAVAWAHTANAQLMPGQRPINVEVIKESPTT